MNGDWWRSALKAGVPVAVKILRGVTGEKGESLGVDEVHQVSPPFALWLVQREKAEVSLVVPQKAEVSLVVPPEEANPTPKPNRRGGK